MTRITTTVVAAAIIVAGITAGIALAGDEPNSQQVTQKDPAEFLQKLVGEWSAVTYAVTDPEQEPYRFEGKERARMLGRQWLVSEYTSEVEGVSIHSMLTIGYDRTQEKFVATYANSMQSSLWTYHGTLNDEGTTLTLKTKGPFLGDPEQQAEFRVVIQSKGADQWTMGSQIQTPENGEWFEFLRFEYQREE